MSAAPPPIPPPRQERLPWVALLLIVGLAALLRYSGMYWGLPSAGHLFSYHPDEFHSLRGALSLILAGDLNPHFFNYGSLYLYLVSVAALLADSGAVGNLSAEGLAQMLGDWTLAARNLNVLCALLTVLVTYLLGHELLGKRAGLLAALALAVMPLHVLHSEYATVDVPQSLFIACALLFAVRIGKQARSSDYLWAGIFAGLAASVKYNGALVVVAPLVAHFVSRGVAELPGETPRRGVPLCSWQPLAMLVFMGAAFALTSPYTFLDWESARRDILFEVQHMRAGEEPARSADPSGWLFHALGLTVTTAGASLVALLGVAGLFVRRAWRAGLGLVVFAALWFCMISLSNVRYGRYEVPLTVALAVLTAAAPYALYLRRAELRLVAVALPLAVVVCGLAASGLLVLRLRELPDPRDAALQAVLAKVPPGRAVGLAWEPWFNSPPVDRCNGGQVLRANPLWSRYQAPLRPLAITGISPEALQQQRPFAFALSEFELRDALRVGDPNARRFREVLGEGYLPAAVTGCAAPLSGLLGWVPPQDWLYAFPTLTVYVRR